MTFELPELPYAYDALAPYMSAETLEFHHDKHHNAYVVKGNEILSGLDHMGDTLEEVVLSAHKQGSKAYSTMPVSTITTSISGTG